MDLTSSAASVAYSVVHHEIVSTYLFGGYTLRPKTPKSIAAEIDRTFNANMKLLEESMSELPKNSRAYLDRVMSRAKLQQQYLETRASRGLDPQDLGSMTRVRYEFSAVISEHDGQVDAKRQAFEDEMEAEFPSDPQPEPAAPVKKSKKKRTK